MPNKPEPIINIRNPYLQRVFQIRRFNQKQEIERLAVQAQVKAQTETAAMEQIVTTQRVRKKAVNPIRVNKAV